VGFWRAIKTLFWKETLWSSIPPISTKRTITSHLNLLDRGSRWHQLKMFHRLHRAVGFTSQVVIICPVFPPPICLVVTITLKNCRMYW
jgi:hypothetical protein